MSGDNAETVPTLSVGVDIGAATTRVAALDPTKPMPTIIRNDLGNESTSTIVSFPRNEARCYGENAASKQITKASETVVDLAPWLFGSSGSNGTIDFAVDSPSVAMAAALTLATRTIGEQELHPSQVAAYFIKCLLAFVPDQAAWRRGTVCLSVPTAANPIAFQALRQAAALAGVDRARTLVAPSSEAVAVYFHHLQYNNLPDAVDVEGNAVDPATVVLVDVGQSCCSAMLITANKKQVVNVASESLAMGSGFIDAGLCAYVYGEMAKKVAHVEELRGDIKTFRKILRECRKAKEVLSTTEESRVQLEGLKGDIDINITISRATLDAVAKPFLSGVETMLHRIKEKMSEEAAAPRVEVIGGGWRTVCVTELIKQTFAVERVGVSLDANLAVAEGSAILAEVWRLTDGVEGDADPAEHPAHAVELLNFDALTTTSPVHNSAATNFDAKMGDWENAEQHYSAADASIHDRLAALNQLDSYVLQTLDAVDACEATAEQKAAMRAALYEVDEYVRGDGQEAPKEELEEKLKTTRARVAENCPAVAAYYAEKEAEEKRKEEELIKLSEERQQEETELKSDPQRLRMAQKRREQGQGLFKEDCFAEAQTRFVQALSILGQLYDTTSEENKKTKDEISLSCYLNIASCSVKLSLWKNAVNNCTNALEIVPDHPKALFRRGQARAAMKDYKEAIADLEKASVVSNGDSAVVAELERAKVAMQKEKEKEKKAFSKMFS